MSNENHTNDSLGESSIQQISDTTKLKRKGGFGILGGAFGKFSFTILTILLTAIITWYVNYRLNYLDPVISITNIEFFFDLENQKDLIEIPTSLLGIDNKGFFGRGLKHFMHLEDLQDFTKMNRSSKIEKRYNQYEKELDIFLGFLSEKNPNYDLMSQYTLDFLRSYGFSGIAAFLVFLEEKNLIKPLGGDREEIEKLKDGTGKIKVAKNLYLLSDSWSKKAKTANQKFMAKKIEWFAERVVYHLVKRRFSELKQFLEKCKRKLLTVKKYDLEAEREILNVIEEKAKKHKKTRLIFQIVNRSEFPLLIFPRCEILFSDLRQKEKIYVKGQLQKTGKNDSQENKINLFKAIIINTKASDEFLVKSLEIPERNLDKIKSTFEENNLQSKISVEIKRHKGRTEKYESDWIRLEKEL